MQKNKIIQSMLFLLMVALNFMGCSAEGETVSAEGETVISPESKISQDIVSFFEKELPAFGYSDSFFINENQDSDLCLIINSSREFREIYSGEKDLPKIDFNRYTLIIGKVRMPESFFYVTRQYVTINNNDAVLNLDIAPVSREGSWPALSTLYFWGLYSKLSVEKVHINKNIR